MDLRASAGRGSLHFELASDVDLAARMYTSIFLSAFEGYRQICSDGHIFFQRLAWDDDDMAVLAEALLYIGKQCTLTVGLEFHVLNNKFGQEGQSAVLKAIEDFPTISIIGCGAAGERRKSIFLKGILRRSSNSNDPTAGGILRRASTRRRSSAAVKRRQSGVRRQSTKRKSSEDAADGGRLFEAFQRASDALQRRGSSAGRMIRRSITGSSSNDAPTTGEKKPTRERQERKSVSFVEG